MGCDIYLHQEVKINGAWHHYREFDFDRDYRVFAKMAGVRGHEVPICEPRGLPDDTTLLTRYSADLWAKDGHSHSFLGASEIKELEAWVCEIDGCLWSKPPFGYLFDNSWGSFIECPEGNPDGLEDIRFVFWFCN